MKEIPQHLIPVLIAMAEHEIRTAKIDNLFRRKEPVVINKQKVVS